MCNTINTAKTGLYAYVMLYCDRFEHDIWGFFVCKFSPIKYLETLNFGTNLGSPMHVLETKGEEKCIGIYML